MAPPLALVAVLLRGKPRTMRTLAMVVVLMSVLSLAVLVADAAVGGTANEGPAAGGNANLHLGKTVAGGAARSGSPLAFAVTTISSSEAAWPSSAITG